MAWNFSSFQVEPLALLLSFGGGLLSLLLLELMKMFLLSTPQGKRTVKINFTQLFSVLVEWTVYNLLAIKMEQMIRYLFIGENLNRLHVRSDHTVLVCNGHHFLLHQGCIRSPFISSSCDYHRAFKDHPCHRLYHSQCLLFHSFSDHFWLQVGAKSIYLANCFWFIAGSISLRRKDFVPLLFSVAYSLTVLSYQNW